MLSKKIGKEKHLLIKKLIKQNHPNPYIESGLIINKKYGKGWRERHTDYSNVNFGKMSYYE